MAGPDTTNPMLTSAALPSVDVRSGGESVTFSVGAFDSGSGVDRVYLYFDHSWQSLVGPQSVISFADSADSFADGLSSASVYFDPASSAGVYGITSAIVYDKAGNWTQYSAADLSAMGISTGFNLLSGWSADFSPPTLNSLSLSNVDVRAGGQSVSFSAGASDSGSGVDRVQIYFDHNWEGQGGFSGVITLSDSTDSFVDGSSARQVYFDPGTPAGTYNITSAIVYDKAGNYTQYSAAQLVALHQSTSFTVLSNTPADTSPPSLSSLSLPTVNLGASGETVIFSAGALDSGTGVDRLFLYFDHSWQGSSGPQSIVEFSAGSDSFLDGSSTSSMFIDRATAVGIFRLVSAVLYDKAGNSTQYSAADLATLGFATGFHVERLPAHNDFSGAGRSDVLWRNDDGTITDWLGTSRGNFTDNSSHVFSGVATSWHVAGTGDFNGDGRVDILWRNDNGSISDWLGQSNGGFAGNGANSSQNVATAWHVAGVGDFNGDGRSDILWRNDDGTMTDWLGTSAGGFAGNGANASKKVGTSWHIVGTGDFNGDGRSDILWQNDNGKVIDWLGQANGGFVNPGVTKDPGLGWHVVGTGDFNGDGIDDVLLRNDNGRISDWLGQSDGNFVDNALNTNTSLGTSWHIVGTGDYNGDAIDDLLLQNANGKVIDWLGQPNGGFVNPGVTKDQGLSWHVQDPFVHDPFG